MIYFGMCKKNYHYRRRRIHRPQQFVGWITPSHTSHRTIMCSVSWYICGDILNAKVYPIPRDENANLSASAMKKFLDEHPEVIVVMGDNGGT